jgi:enoyl-CoA hydratase
MNELGHALLVFDQDAAIACMIITGNEKAFAAGADIGAMADYTFADVYNGDYITRNWEQIRRVRKPIIAAVAGYALGGGCELAMMCDFIIAADTAKSSSAPSPGRAGLSACPGLYRKPRRWICV